VLECVVKLAADIIRSMDPKFRTVHQRLRGATFAPYFDNCIGAIDGTHVPLQCLLRRWYSTQEERGSQHRMFWPFVTLI
jgi:hypothetical protein